MTTLTNSKLPLVQTIFKEQYSKLRLTFISEGVKRMNNIDSFQVVYVNGSCLYFKSGKYYSDSIQDLVKSGFKLGQDSVELSLGQGITLPLFNIIKVANVTRLGVGLKAIHCITFLRIVLKLVSKESIVSTKLVLVLLRKCR